jgi:hypothetical protein
LFLILEQLIWIYAGSDMPLAAFTGLGSFLNNQFLNPGGRRAKMPAAFVYRFRFSFRFPL